VSAQANAAEREKLIFARIAWLEHRIEGLAGNWRRVPILLSTAVLGIPAAFIWGIGIGFVVFCLGLSLGGVSAYLLAIRKSTCEDEIRVLRKELVRLHAP
jgi:hypothetical protein